jgi:Ca2+-binding EF-hand superfamily protein
VEEDEEALKKELKEAFRIYDKDCMGYISTGGSSASVISSSSLSADTLREILRELDNKLTEEDIDNIIEEVDEDGSGTLDFDGEQEDQ